MNAKQDEIMPEIESHIAEGLKVRRRTIITRKRHAKQLITAAIANLIVIFLMPYLFGEPWSSVPARLMGLGGFGLFGLWTWSNWPTNVDDDQA